MSGYPAMLYPHDYWVLWDLALVETDETARGGRGVEGNTVHDLYPADWQGDLERRRRAGHSMRTLERLGLVERVGRRRRLVVWQTTARGYDIVFP
jgi:hypothetical protein